jgi:copper resistance protein B
MEPLPEPVYASMIHSFTLAEILEYRVNSSGPDTFRWDIFGWVGTDWNRLWYKTEGSQQLGGAQAGDSDLQLLYGRLIAPFWDFQIGVRTEQSLGTGRADTRTYAVIGFQGLSPYLFDIEPSLFISDQGQVSARVTVSFDLLLTQRLVLQPRFEGTAAIQSDEKRGMGDGLNETDVGLRLRYEIRREIAPYVGVSWLRQYGETASMSRSEGDSTDSISFVAGVRLWW